MSLSKNQRWMLTKLQSHCNSPPSFGKLLLEHRIRFLRLAIIVAAGIWLASQMPSVLLNGLFYGIFIGFALAAVSRDLYEIWRYTDSWPIFRKIIEWQRVDALLASSSEAEEVV